MSTNSDLGPLPHWDLSGLYPGLDSEPFRGDVAALEDHLDEMDLYLANRDCGRAGTIPDAPAAAEIINGYLERINTIIVKYADLARYVSSFISTDSYNMEARRLWSTLEQRRVRIDRQTVLFRGWLGLVAADADRWQGVLAAEGPLQDHRFFLEETAEQSRYLMSDDEEALASELANSGANAWARLQGTVTSQVRVSFERDGQTENLPMTVLQNFRNHPDEGLRRRAYEAELAAWELVREPLAASLNGVKGAVITLDRRRGRRDALHSALDDARMDQETLEAMLSAIRARFPAFRRYFKAKAGLLGKERLDWWDLFAPVGRTDRVYSFADARVLLLEQFAAFSPRLAAMTEEAFEENWIDAEPRDGKRGGAFCMSILSLDESRILCNYDGSLDAVSTLAHELGHAFHNFCQAGKTPLQSQKPMTLAETASIMNETIVNNAALAEAAGDRQAELAILETFLNGASQVTVDIYSRFLFETQVFERRAEAELSADELCELMLACQKEAYGDALDHDHLHPYMWAWKSHYYRPTLSFYNFPYAFGLLFGLGVYAIYQERGQDFVAEYEEFLRQSGEGWPADLAGRFGIDLRDGAFWRRSLDLVEEWIDRYEAAAQA